MAWIRACGGGSPAVPDGKTITPINDVTIWQQCAGIANPTYTTLAEVLADVGMLSTLMSSNNAVDYLLRSKMFIDNRLVPKMTSNTAPSGVASASSELLNHEAYTAFDRDIESIWEATTTGGTQTGYLQYDFGEPTKVAGLKLVNWSSPGTYTQTLKNITVSGSNDGNTFTTITSENVNISADKYEYTKVFNAEYNIYRVSITSTQSFSAANNPTIREVQFYSDGIGITQSADAMQYIGANNYASNTLLADSDWRKAICNSTYIENVLNFKNPAMSSNTSPTGYVASASSQYDSTYYPAYKAFDNNDATGWLAGNGVLSGNLTLQLPTTHKMYCAFVKPYKDNMGTHAGDFNIVGSTDGVNWSYNLASDQFTNNAPYEKMLEIYDGNEYSYYRINILNSAANQGVGMFTVIFYGREDV